MTNKYIVVFKDGTPKSEVDKAVADVKAAGTTQSGTVTHEYDGTVLLGFAAAIPDDHFQSLQALSLTGGSKIDYIEADGVMTTQ